MLFDNASSYFFWIGTFYLIILTWQDFRHKMTVDDRHNYFMMGVALSLVSHFRVNLKFFLGMILFTIIFSIFLGKTKALGEADVKSISWAIWGLGYSGIPNLVMFLVSLGSLTAIYSIVKLGIFKYKKPTPFYAVILLAFWFNAFYKGLY